MDICNIAKFLKENDNFLILTHKSPDGDTLGSGFGLCYALRFLNKNANVVCSDEIPERYSYFTKEYAPQDFEVKTVVAVDVADPVLLGKYSDMAVDFCIDHHKSNKFYAKETYVDETAAATVEIIAQILLFLEVEFTPLIADCIYTGLCTDTGCFRYSNVTPHTLLTASAMLSNGADAYNINRIMFETKTRARVEVEKDVYQNMKFFEEGKIAVISLSQELLQKTGAGEDELEGVSAMGRQIEGVEIALTLREKPNGEIKVSARTGQSVDASEVCKNFGGGGHARAAGCSVMMSLEDACEALVNTAKKYL